MKAYSPISQSESYESDIEDSNEKHRAIVNKNGWISQNWLPAFLLCLVATISAWLIYEYHQTEILQRELDQLKHQLKTTKLHMHEPVSPYAGLQLEQEETIHADTSYGDLENLDLADKLWNEIDIDPGTIALYDDYVKDNKLAIAQRLPWDANKGIYLLHGYHQLHCIKQIYLSLREYQQNLPQSRGPWHAIHCLDSLRRDVICNADDTPRATTQRYAPNTGVGQMRQCRSWKKLESWARENYSCFSNIVLGPNQTNLDRYRFCPKGSPYLPLVAKVFADAEGV